MVNHVGADEISIAVTGGAVVYPARVSAKLPQTYVLHTFVLFILIGIALVVFLKHQWG